MTTRTTSDETIVWYDDANDCGYGSGDGNGPGFEGGWGGGAVSEVGEGTSYYNGTGLGGDGVGDGAGFSHEGGGHSKCIGDVTGAGECFPTTEISSILFEIGVPEHLHNLFLPLTPSSMLTAQDFTQAETQKQRDAILGILELKQENTTWK